MPVKPPHMSEEAIARTTFLHALFKQPQTSHSPHFDTLEPRLGKPQNYPTSSPPPSFSYTSMISTESNFSSETCYIRLMLHNLDEAWTSHQRIAECRIASMMGYEGVERGCCRSSIAQGDGVAGMVAEGSWVLLPVRCIKSSSATFAPASNYSRETVSGIVR